MKTQVVHYQLDGVDFKGYLALPDNIAGKVPGVLIAHAWRGQDHFAREKAEELAKLGYAGFALDLYGNGATAKSNEEAQQLMLPLFLDRTLLRARMNAGFEVLKGLPVVDQESIGAIGFCFGGLSAIELLRSGTPVKGVVSFHGVLGNTLDKYKATLAPDSKKILGSLLILHGFKDPLVSAADIRAIQDEMTKANVDWQMNIYGQAAHAFTNPEADDQNSGLIYHRQVAERAWLAMTNFFHELFRV